MDHNEFLDALLEILASGDIKTQQGLLCKIETVFRQKGYGAVLDAGAGKLRWMKKFELAPPA